MATILTEFNAEVEVLVSERIKAFICLWSKQIFLVLVLGLEGGVSYSKTPLLRSKQLVSACRAYTTNINDA